MEASLSSLLVSHFHRAVDNMSGSLPSQQKMGSQDRSQNLFCNLILEVASNHFCPIFFVKNKSLCPAYTWGEEIIQVRNHCKPSKQLYDLWPLFACDGESAFTGFKIRRVSRTHQWNNIYITHLTVSLQPNNLLRLQNNFMGLTSHKPSFVPIQMYPLFMYSHEVWWNIRLLRDFCNQAHLTIGQMNHVPMKWNNKWVYLP